MDTSPTAAELLAAARAAIAKAGGGAALARALGITRGAVHQWTRVPAEMVPRVSAITGIPRHDLRGDLWNEPGHPSDSAAPAQPEQAA